MAAQGLESLFSLDDHAVMGLREVRAANSRHSSPRARGGRLCACAKSPMQSFCIDSPDFTHRIAQRLEAPRCRRSAPSIMPRRRSGPRVLSRAQDGALFRSRARAASVRSARSSKRTGCARYFVGHPVIERADADDGRRSVARAPWTSPPTRRFSRFCPAAAWNEVQPAASRRSARRLRASRGIPGLVCFCRLWPCRQYVSGSMTRGWPAPLHIFEERSRQIRGF